MAYSRDCSTYWCDECECECVIDWHNSGDVYFVLKCTKCPWTKVYIAQSDVVAHRERRDENHGAIDWGRFYRERGE